MVMVISFLRLFTNSFTGKAKLAQSEKELFDLTTYKDRFDNDVYREGMLDTGKAQAFGDTNNWTQISVLGIWTNCISTPRRDAARSFIFMLKGCVAIGKFG